MLSRAERGERTPSLETLSKVCEGLGLGLSAFFPESAPDQPVVFRDVRESELIRQQLDEASRSLDRALKLLPPRPVAGHRQLRERSATKR